MQASKEEKRMAEAQPETPEPKPVLTPAAKSLPLPAVQQAISSIRFGVVQITIQDGKIVQIDKTEKIRLA